MIKRIFDVVIAICALIAAAPVVLFAAVGIGLNSPGPILYRARRIARDRRRFASGARPARHMAERRRGASYRGREFTLYKLRTMRVDAGGGASPITAQNDPRVFPFGALLRAAKIDELPQLLNVLKGDMTLVGPRPEAPEIVRHHYTPDDLDTLRVLPGLTSPGSLYYYTHCEAVLDTADVTVQYAEQLLPVKLALDRVYVENANVAYDLRVLVRTAGVLAARVVGKRQFAEPPEMAHVRFEPHVSTRMRNGPGSVGRSGPGMAAPDAPVKGTLATIATVGEP